MTRYAEWQGPVGAAWASEWRGTDRSFAVLSVVLDHAILAAAPPGSGTALDIGCGAGATSLALAAARPDLEVVGVDIAGELIAVARARAAGIANARFAVADLNRDLPDSPPFDLLVSRHGVMFFDDPAAVFARLRDAAKPGAALVFSCFRAPAFNPWAGALVTAIGGAAPPSAGGDAPGPFAFADPDRVGAVLAAGGWRDAAPEAVDFIYVAGQGDDPVAAAVSFFRRIGPVASAVNATAEADRPAMLDKLAVALQGYRDGDRIALPAAAWIWRAVA